VFYLQFFFTTSEMGKWQVPTRRTRHKRLHCKALTLRLISTTVRIPLDSDVNGDTFQGNQAGKKVRRTTNTYLSLLSTHKAYGSTSFDANVAPAAHTRHSQLLSDVDTSSQLTIFRSRHSFTSVTHSLNIPVDSLRSLQSCTLPTSLLLLHSAIHCTHPLQCQT
jgi:hypothetical protein